MATFPKYYEREVMLFRDLFFGDYAQVRLRSHDAYFLLADCSATTGETSETRCRLPHSGLSMNL